MLVQISTNLDTWNFNGLGFIQVGFFSRQKLPKSMLQLREGFGTNIGGKSEDDEDPTVCFVYKMEVLRGRQFDGPDPSACWNTIYQRIRKMHSSSSDQAEDASESFFKSDADMFGFSDPHVLKLIQLSMATKMATIDKSEELLQNLRSASLNVVVQGLAVGVMMNIVSMASDLMQDFKIGYLTLSSPRSMFFSQVLGTAIGYIMAPLVFWFFYHAYFVGDPNRSYPAPHGALYRGIALLGVEGFGSLRHNCLNLSTTFFIGAILINVVTIMLKKYETKYRQYRFIPSPMCMAIPFYLGAYLAIDMCVGSLILFIWEKKNKKAAKELAPAVASDMICGDSLWGILAAILAMKFVSAAFLNR